MGAIIEDSFSKRVTHIFTADLDSLLKKIGAQNFKRFKGVSCVVIAETLLSMMFCRVIYLLIIVSMVIVNL